ncbi:MAG: hypothetical protein M1831_003179 [Alyxoria varia]|nr:MAG: hypothetical protein M1831_003179 [Alyxoria varia]
MRPHYALLDLRSPCYAVAAKISRSSAARARSYSSPSSPSASRPPSPPDLRLPPQPHNSIPTFLDYARHVGLSPTHTTYIGILYEYRVRDALARHGFTLTRVGGRSDLGVDLLGWWDLPGRVPAESGVTAPEQEERNAREGKTPKREETRLRAFVQCKALGKKIKPNVIRELEGTFAGLSRSIHDRSSSVAHTSDANSSSEIPTIALLAAPKGATPGVRDALKRSKLPMGFMLVGLRTGRLAQVFWNSAAKRVGLKGVKVEVRYNGAGSGRGGGSGGGGAGGSEGGARGRAGHEAGENGSEHRAQEALETIQKKLIGEDADDSHFLAKEVILTLNGVVIGESRSVQERV